jgi:hypothetical protein
MTPYMCARQNCLFRTPGQTCERRLGVGLATGQDNCWQGTPILYVNALLFTPTGNIIRTDRGLRRGSATARLPGTAGSKPAGSMDIYYECCVLTGREYLASD